MRIAVIGAQCVGKSTLIQHFLQRWPQYALPERSYRDIIKEQNLALNEQGTLESQKIIRDVLVDMALENAGKSFTLHDRNPIDNLVYTLWLAEKDKLEGSNSEVSDFIATSLLLTKESMKFYDIIFWLPINENIPLENSENRSINIEYRKEIDNIFHGVYEHYKTHTGIIFAPDDQPVMIPLEGELYQKLETVAMYIGPDGNLVENEGSAITDLQTAYEEECLRRQVR
jgi:hypothetical protein